MMVSLWKKPLEDWQTGDPVLVAWSVDLPDAAFAPTHADLLEIFPEEKSSLKTWGRAGEDGIHQPAIRGPELVGDPHWLGTCGPTDLHTDIGYPRYSHQLVLRADGFELIGRSEFPIEVARGMFYVVDTHSPHQLRRIERGVGQWFVVVSIDLDEADLTGDSVIPALTEYACSHPFSSKGSND